MEKFGRDYINEVDDELLALDAILAEVSKGELSDDFEKNEKELQSLDNDNVEVFLQRKFMKYGNDEDERLNDQHFNKNVQDYYYDKKSGVKVEQKVFSFTDPFFGLRIINPQISSILLTERMANRKAIAFHQLVNYHMEDFTNDWVVAGVLLSKETKQSSKSAKPFSVWRLSDLKGDLKTISISLFQNAHNELWKTPTGMCVAVLNPSFIENKLYGSDIACLCIETAKKVMLLGMSKDLGQCKANKKNGDRCKNFVNLSECDFCLFHVKTAYRKLDRPIKNERLYLNLSHAGLLGKVNQRDKRIMDTLNRFNKLPPKNDSLRSVDIKHDIGFARGQFKSASTVETNMKQRLSDFERLKTINSLNVSNELSTATKSKFVYAAQETKPPAMQKAIDILKKFPIEKINPNSIRGTEEGKKRALAGLREVNEPKRPKIESSKLLGITNILENESVHKDLIVARRNEDEDNYFRKLGKKEAMEEKMLKAYKLPCKAVICKICKYTAFSAADRCKEEQHLLKVIDAVKRFFQCKDCGNRTTTLFKIPKLSCTNCRSSRWEHCAMIRDRKVCDPIQQLSVRGDEEKFLGSTTSKLNINLLIPTE